MVNVNTELCIGCGNCVLYCPVEALTVIEDKASVDLDQCVECSTCVRSGSCPVDALSMPIDFDEIREIRHYLSDPTTTKKLTGVPGRGTEEVKTNDVTGRVRRGEVGLCIELGRPGLGTTFNEVQKVSTALAGLGVHFEEQNPVTALFIDQSGRIDERVLDEKVLSGIIEAKTSLEMIPQIIQTLSELETHLDTVFSLGLICRFDDDGGVPALRFLEECGVEIRENAKINVGIGRPLSET